MSDCDRLSDRMPRVAAGAEEWSAAESAHLATCGACADEWRLVVAARGLGAGEGLREPPETMAATLLARLRELEAQDRRRRRLLRGATWGGLAVAASLLLAVVLNGPRGTAGRDSVQVAVASPFAVSLPELEDADAEELQEVLDAFDAPLVESTTLERPAADEVETEDLERVLRAWEG